MSKEQPDLAAPGWLPFLLGPGLLETVYDLSEREISWRPWPACATHGRQAALFLDCAGLRAGMRRHSGCSSCRQVTGQGREPEPQRRTRPHGGDAQPTCSSYCSCVLMSRCYSTLAFKYTGQCETTGPKPARKGITAMGSVFFRIRYLFLARARERPWYGQGY